MQTRTGAEFPVRLNLVGWVLWLVVLCGCGGQPSQPPVDREKASQIKSGMALAEVEAILGPCREATRAEIKRLHELSERMPEQVRKNALADRSVAWGNDRSWLAGKVNADNVVWVVTWESN